MLAPFYGEFLLHPSPLEISGNTCSHNCCYCFSNIRRSNRVAETQKFINQIKKNNGTYISDLINGGYSICVSNRTDPFSKSNEVVSETFFKYISQIENGLFIQTKGGESFDSLTGLIGDKKNVVMYFTITSNNNDILRKIEPGAPTFEEKARQIKQSIKNGWPVIVAFNPLVREWMPEEEFNDTLSKFIDVGVNHFIFQRLHMTSQDVNNFTSDRLKRFDGDILERACKRSDKSDQLYLQDAILKNSHKANLLAFGMPYKTDFFTDIRASLGKCFPSLYDFINQCFENGSGEYVFDDFIRALNFDKDIIDKPYPGMQAYILRVARNVWKGNESAQSVKTLRDVLSLYWDDKRIQGSPQNNLLFQKIENRKETVLYFDGEIHREKRMVIMPEI